MKFSEDGASVDLKSLLIHTVKKILLLTNKEEWKNLAKGLTLVGAWGMDGAGNQQTTMQPWKEQSSTEESEEYSDTENDDHAVEMREILDDGSYNQAANEKSDKSVFIISLKPLELKSGEQVIWRNETPSSINYCRPIKFKFVKESDTIVQKTYDSYDEQFKKTKQFPVTWTVSNSTFIWILCAQ